MSYSHDGHGLAVEFLQGRGVEAEVWTTLPLAEHDELAVLLYQCETERFGVPEDGFAPLSRFTDGETVDDDARMAMSWAVGSGLIQGTAGDRLEPEAAASRGQAAVILHRYLLHHGVAAGK